MLRNRFFTLQKVYVIYFQAVDQQKSTRRQLGMLDLIAKKTDNSCKIYVQRTKRQHQQPDLW